jgi:subtilisin family serine protease
LCAVTSFSNLFILRLIITYTFFSDLVAALEWAEARGADIVSASLGYMDWLGWEDLDGETSISSRGIKVAVAKGVLVVVANGNSGNARISLLVSESSFLNFVFLCRELEHPPMPRTFSPWELSRHAQSRQTAQSPVLALGDLPPMAGSSLTYALLDLL